MKYQLPHAVYTAFDETTKLYTASQVQAAFDAGRAAGLDEAIKAVDDIESQTYTFAGETFDDAGKSLMLAADAIRNLKETPCA